MKQEYMIKYGDDGKEVFFFAHSFKTAREHAEAYIERNKGKFEMKLYMLNERNYGPQWALIKVVKDAKTEPNVGCIDADCGHCHGTGFIDAYIGIESRPFPCPGRTTEGAENGY